ncbi:hypothetical protein K4F52_008900 [Lecanicillium sp. MT-2017a]|nr:hypothetical protein K4F52_008900 [Lecanicillium sp. MT-2017a]
MQPTQGNGHRSQAAARAPGSFSPLTSSNKATPSSSSSNAANAAYQPQRPPSLSRRQPPPPLQLDHSSSDDGAVAAAAASSSAAAASASGSAAASLTVPKSRQRAASPGTPIYSQFTSHSNTSSPSLHNFSRPNAVGSPRVATHGSPSTLSKAESKKYGATQGLFDSSMPSTAASNLSHVGAASSNMRSASHIAAQAAVMSHQNSQNNSNNSNNSNNNNNNNNHNNHNSHANSHSRQRSQTAPFPADASDSSRRTSGGKAPLSPPTLSFTESSTPRDSASPTSNTGGLNIDRLGGHSSALGGNPSAAATAANVVFPRSGHSSPRDAGSSPQPPLPLPPPIPSSVPERPPSKSEKAKSKLFSRPVKIGAAKSEGKDKALPSPSKIGSALSALQRGNFSTSSLVDSSNQSLYSLNNSSSATIRPFDSEEKSKEKKHHFLSRQKQKLRDEYHLPLSSVASNSRPTDPNAPSSLYNFHVPSSVGLSTSSFSKVKKDRKHGERSDSRLDNESSFNLPGDLSGTTAFPSLSQQSTLYYDASDSAKMAMNLPTSIDEAWPYLKTLLLVVFQGEDVRLPVEDINRIVQMHIQFCIHKRSPSSVLDDLRDLLTAGFTTMDRTLRATPEDKFIPTLVELWLFTYTTILPYLQSVFLPLDLEVAGRGPLMTIDQARDFWGGVMAPAAPDTEAKVVPPSALLDVRRLVLSAYRDIVILPRYDTLKTIFSRLSLEFLPSSFANMAMASPSAEAAMSTSPPEYFPPMIRPGTAMSLDPSVGSYNSTSTTLLGEAGGGGGTGSGSERGAGRSRAVSNVSFGSHGSDGQLRPFTPGSNSAHVVLSSVREQNVEDSKYVTDMVGRMLQCVSVLSGLAGAGGNGGGSPNEETNSKKMVELCKMLKLNWLGRGRTGRNRRGIVGGRVKRDEIREELRVA